MAATLARQVRAVRALSPWLRNSRAVVCVEHNGLWIVDNVRKALVAETERDPSLLPMTFVHDDAVFGTPASRRQTGEAGVDPEGRVSVDLNTSRSNKVETAWLITTLLDDRLLHWHARFVANASPDPDYQRELLRDMPHLQDMARLRQRLQLPPPRPGIVHDDLRHVLDDEARVRMRRLFVEQFKRIAWKKKITYSPQSGEPRLSKIITGKIKPGDMDDAYMALHIALHGAKYYFGGRDMH